jgi:hypothetical protein
MLMSWGPLQFDVVRTNIHEWGRATSADWAKHEVLGAPIQKEFTGPGDDELVLSRSRVPDVHQDALSGAAASWREPRPDGAGADPDVSGRWRSSDDGSRRMAS